MRGFSFHYIIAWFWLSLLNYFGGAGEEKAAGLPVFRLKAAGRVIFASEAQEVERPRRAAWTHFRSRKANEHALAVYERY